MVYIGSKDLYLEFPLQVSSTNTKIAAVLAGIEGVENISDDIIIHAPDKESHDKRLHAVLRRLENCDSTLYAEKCQFNMDKLVFMGMLLSEKGIVPTAARVRVVVEAREPENASEVRSFLGLAGYSSRFIPQFACISEPLRRLTRKDAKFHLYGRKFDLVTDHKALEAIYSPRSKPCARIERWVLRLQPYDFQVIHIPGTHNIADPLSRLLGPSAKGATHAHKAEEYVRFIAVCATPSALTTKEVEQISANDVELQRLKTAIQTGCFDDCPAYRHIAGELCVIGQIILRGTRFVRACHGCQLVARPDVPEPLSPTVMTEGPWQNLATDLLGPLPDGHSILVVVDYYSRYYEYAILKSTTAEKVIDSLEDIFSRHGLPLTIKSYQFQMFCQENGIHHIKTTPKWAQANGEVERQNASLMKRVQIAQAEGQDWKRELRKYVTVCEYVKVCLQIHTTLHNGQKPSRTYFPEEDKRKVTRHCNTPQ